MKLVWTVKLYHTGGSKKPYRVKVEGNPTLRLDKPWTCAEGKGEFPSDAVLEATEKMSKADAAEFRRFVNWHREVAAA